MTAFRNPNQYQKALFHVKKYVSFENKFIVVDALENSLGLYSKATFESHGNDSAEFEMYMDQWANYYWHLEKANSQLGGVSQVSVAIQALDVELGQLNKGRDFSNRALRVDNQRRGRMSGVNAFSACDYDDPSDFSVRSLIGTLDIESHSTEVLLKVLASGEIPSPPSSTYSSPFHSVNMSGIESSQVPEIVGVSQEGSDGLKRARHLLHSESSLVLLKGLGFVSKALKEIDKYVDDLFLNDSDYFKTFEDEVGKDQSEIVKSLKSFYKFNALCWREYYLNLLKLNNDVLSLPETALINDLERENHGTINACMNIGEKLGLFSLSDTGLANLANGLEFFLHRQQGIFASDFIGNTLLIKIALSNKPISIDLFKSEVVESANSEFGSHIFRS